MSDLMAELSVRLSKCYTKYKIRLKSSPDKLLLIDIKMNVERFIKKNLPRLFLLSQDVDKRSIFPLYSLITLRANKWPTIPLARLAGTIPRLYTFNATANATLTLCKII